MYLIYGSTPKEIVQKYAIITGRPALPPLWTFGLWLSTSFTTGYDENTVNKFLDGMAEREIHTSVFHFDCFWMKGFEWCNFKFDEEMFPDAKGQIARIKARGNHVSIAQGITTYF
jgi:alpha-D-xyloside xylohydrolase